MICLAPKKRGIFQQVKFPMQDAEKLTSIAFPLHVSAGVFFHIQRRKVLSYNDLTVYSKPMAFIFIWMNDNKGNHLRSERCVFLPQFPFLFCKYVCLVFFLLVYLIVTLIGLVSWLFGFFFVCFCVFFFYIRLPKFFLCLFFFLVYNVCVFDHVNVYSSFDQSFLS